MHFALPLTRADRLCQDGLAPRWGSKGETMRIALVPLLFVLGCAPTVISGEGGSGGAPDADDQDPASPTGTGGAGGAETGGSGVGGGDSCSAKACFSEEHILAHLKADSTWMPSDDPQTVDCPPLSELQDPEPGVCFQSEPTVDNPGDGLMCCYAMSTCCL